MGKWKRQHLIVEPGDRDVAEVAGHLRASLASLDRRLLPHPERAVEIQNGQVYWDTGERYTNLWEFLEATHTELDVPCEWLLGIYQHEVDLSGSASLYTWVDGEFALVESTPNKMVGDETGVRYLRAEWGIDPRPDWRDVTLPELPNLPSADRTSNRVTDNRPPLVGLAAEFADESATTRAAARTTLTATPPDVLRGAVETLAERVARADGRERVDALEQLYAAAASSAVPVDVTPAPVLDCLDERGRAAMLAAAIVRELSGRNPAANVIDGEPPARRQAARYLGLEGASQSNGLSVSEALGDGDPHVRTGVARSLYKLAWERLNTPDVLDGEADEATLFERLSTAAADDSGRVRAGAIPAVALLAFFHEIGDEDVALSAIASELAADSPARHSVEWLLGTYFWELDGSPSSLAALTGAVLTTLGDHPLLESLRDSTDLFDIPVLDAALTDIQEDGWAPADAETGTLVTIATLADDSLAAADRVAEALTDRIADDPLGVTEGLVSIADDEPSPLDAVVPELATLADEGSTAATEALALVATEHPDLVRRHWDAIRPVLAFVGDRARPAAEVVAGLADDGPDALAVSGADTRAVIARASSAMYESLDHPDSDEREVLVSSLVTLADADPSVAPPGIEPFIEQRDGGADDESAADDIDDRDPLSVVAEHDPDAAAAALASLLPTLDPSADYRAFTTGARIAGEFPAVAVRLFDRLPDLLVRANGERRAVDLVSEAIAAAAERDPSVAEPHVQTLLQMLVHSRPAVRENVARALAAVEQASPGTLLPAVSPLADDDRGEDWPVDTLAESAPHLVDRMVHETVAADDVPTEGTTNLLSTVAEHRPETAEAGVTRLIERATAVGYSSRLWSVLESIAESNPELVAVGLDDIVAITVDSVDVGRGRGRKPARPLVVLAEAYPRRVWALLEEHDPDDDSTLLDRASRSRVEEKIGTILDAAGPAAPLSGDSSTDADE